MRRFLLALQFLTIIPIGRKPSSDKNELSQATAFFPLIGLLLGLILAGTSTLLSLIPLERFLANTILVILLIILTGGLHLDGLADTADALLSRKNKREMLKVMRDSHIGVMGVLSIICILLIKLALLSSLNPAVKSTALILMCLVSRYALAFSIFSFPYARQVGKAKVFFEGMNLKLLSWATVITLLFSFVLRGREGLIIFLLAIIFTFLIGKFITGKIGGISGDTLGATSELVEVFSLLSILIFTGN